MSRSSRLWKLILPGVALVATLVVMSALLLNTRESPQKSRVNQAEGKTSGQPGGRQPGSRDKAGSGEIANTLKENASLASRRLPIAFVTEKLQQQGGEASGEVKNGPAQEQYDQRAYPRKYIEPRRTRGAARAYQQANARAATPAGQQQISKALGTAVAQKWTPMGPRSGLALPVVTYTGKSAVVSGRTTSLAIGKRCTKASCVLYVGTAGGGVWKTTNALAAQPRWAPISSDIPSNAIGTVYLAPNGDLYVGTGEPNGSSDSEAGVGLYKSTDQGTSFTKVRTRAYGSNFTVDRAIASVAVDPRNSQHMYVGTAVARHGASSVNGGRFTPPGSPKIGLYESNNGGRTWHLSLSRVADVVDPTAPNGNDFFRGGISKILFDPTHPKTVYASMFDYGLFRRVGNRPWHQIYTIKTPGDLATGLDSRIEFDLATLPNGKTRIYLGDSTYYGNATAGYVAALLRTDDATKLKPNWTLLSNPKDGTRGYGSYNFCHAQCSYDMFVESPAGHPNQVVLGGSMNYAELTVFGGPGNSNGRSVVRSTDAGRHFADMTNDVHRNGLHPDQHALVFVPGSAGKMFFTGSDGGVWRQRGPFVDATGQCAKRGLSGALLLDCQQFLAAIPAKNTPINTGLATLQYQSVSVAKNGRVIQGGTQDNGTWENNRKRGWAETVGGDGGQSDFNTARPRIRYHSYYLPQHDVNFQGGDPRGWDWISDPLLASGEAASFYVPLRADPVVAGTVFDGLQHIWRTRNNGGKRAYLDKYCNELTGSFPKNKPCGNWKPLGGKQGDLSSAFWGRKGADIGNYVVAIERAATNKSTMWAATRYGRLFISNNANAKKPAAVNYTRLDIKLGLPQRFVSGIAIDPTNPYRAYVSYSGYSAYSPGGHVYEVTYHPRTKTSSARNLSFNLGDQPVTDIVYSAKNKAWFISTDFGVLTRTRGQKSWVATQGLPRVAVYGLTLDQPSQQLFAATHGRSIWKLPVR